MSEFNVDPTFSVYQLVERIERDTSVLNHRRTMTIISHEIENATIKDGANNVVFSSFQRMSRFLPQINRYRELAKQAKQVFVFGVMDTPLPEIDDVTYVPLQPTDQLAKEWFLVSYGEDYFSALATEELSHIDDPDGERVFRGIWSFDVEMVQILNEWLSGIVGLRLEQQLLANHDFDNQIRLMTNTIGRLNVRMMDADEMKNQQIRDEISTLMGSGLYKAMKHLQETPQPIDQNYTPRVQIA